MKQYIQWVAGVLLLALVTFIPVAAQNTTITLTPFTDDAYGFSSVAPDGWTQAAPGILMRKQSAADGTLIAQQAAPLTSDAVMQALLPQLALKAAPDSVGTYSGVLTWTLYKVDVQVATGTVAVDLALAEANGKTYVVLIQTSPDEYDALHSGLFLPVLDALTPLAEATPEAVPYAQEDVTFSNGDVTLAGTLTLPEGDGPFPAIVLVTGSGPQDRDESIAPTAAIKPFRLIADGLTRAGMAVLRYDDRGVGKSTGDFAAATTVDFAGDASAAIDYLLTRSEINPDQIGLLGHSEGGLVAAMLAASDPHLAFAVSMAGPAVSGADVLLKQNERILKAEGSSDAVIQAQLAFLPRLFALIEAKDADGIKQLTHDTVLEQAQQLPADQQAKIGDLEKYAAQRAIETANNYNTDWWRNFLTYNPGDDWAKTTIPVLAIYGKLDTQVDADQNAPAFEAAMKQAGNSDYQVTILPDANHLMQAATTGSPTEYATLKQDFTPDFLPTVIDWLAQHVDMKTAS